MALKVGKEMKVKVELHVHTNYSYDCQTTFWQIIEKCKAEEIDVLGIADHNEIEGALGLQKVAPFRIIVGQEVLTRDGEIVGFFLKKFIDPGSSVDQTIKEIKKQGGIVYLPHPLDKTTRKTAIDPGKLENLIDEIDVIEIHNGRTVFPWDNNSARKLAIAKRKVMAVGSDAHTKYELGRNYMVMKDFSNPQQFIESLQSFEHKTSYVLPWAFFLTKYYRWRKRYRRERIEKISEECDLCGGKSVKILYKKKGELSQKYLITDDSYGSHLQIVKCVGCGLVFAYPRESQLKVLEKYQNFKDPLYEVERSARSMNQQGIVQRLEKMVRGKKILDVGCATGGLLSVAIDEGWEVFGVEPSKWAAQLAKKKYKLNVQAGTLDDLKLEREFDAITCIDVIEHVTSARKLIVQINSLLKKGGALCIVTPDKGSLVARIMGERWWHIRPDHISYFDRQTLTMLLEGLGFRIEKVERYKWTFSYDYWASRFQKNMPWIYHILMLLKKMPLTGNLTKRSYGVNFHDSLEVYCTKQKEVI